VDQTIGLLDSLVTLHHEVGSSSADMSSGCEALLAEKAALQVRGDCVGAEGGWFFWGVGGCRPQGLPLGADAFPFCQPTSHPPTKQNLPPSFPLLPLDPPPQEFADALRARLAFFDGYEQAAAEFAAVSTNPAGGALLPLLGRLDEAIAYASSNPQYADSIAYAAKFRQLQARALGLVRAQVQAALRTASQQVQQAVADAAAAGGGAGGGLPISPTKSGRLEGGGLGLVRQGSAGGRRQAVPLLPERLEVSLLYVRFRAAAEPGIRGGCWLLVCVCVCVRLCVYIVVGFWGWGSRG